MDGDDLYEIGDIVALVEKQSTPSSPKILLGKVLRSYPRRREVLLAYLAPVPNKKATYTLAVGQTTWIESYDARIYPVDIVYEESNNVYKLRTKVEDIYKVWAGHQ